MKPKAYSQNGKLRACADCRRESAAFEKGCRRLFDENGHKKECCPEILTWVSFLGYLRNGGLPVGFSKKTHKAWVTPTKRDTHVWVSKVFA